MSTPIGIKVDGTTYHVAVEYDSIKREFEIMEGNGKGTSISGRAIRDLIGTYYNYKMTIRSLEGQQTDYDNLYLLLSKPYESHSVELPFGQGFIAFTAMIESGDDKYVGIYNNTYIWDELDIKFIATEPKYYPAIEDDHTITEQYAFG